LRKILLDAIHDDWIFKTRINYVFLPEVQYKRNQDSNNFYSTRKQAMFPVPICETCVADNKSYLFTITHLSSCSDFSDKTLETREQINTIAPQ